MVLALLVLAYFTVVIIKDLDERVTALENRIEDTTTAVVPTPLIPALRELKEETE